MWRIVLLATHRPDDIVGAVMTLGEWALALLQAGGWPTPGAQAGIVAQAVEEGSEAIWDPLDSERVAAGSSDYNPAGVQDYPSLEVGLQTTLATLRNGDYPQVLAALQRGSSPAYVQAIANSPWGTWGGDPGAALQLLAQVQGAWADYSSRPVAGSTEGPPPASTSAAAPIQAVGVVETDAGGENMPTAYLVEEPGGPGYWCVAVDLTSKVPIQDPATLEALRQAGAKDLTLDTDGRQLAVIPTVSAS